MNWISGYKKISKYFLRSVGLSILAGVGLCLGIIGEYHFNGIPSKTAFRFDWGDNFKTVLFVSVFTNFYSLIPINLGFFLNEYLESKLKWPHFSRFILSCLFILVATFGLYWISLGNFTLGLWMVWASLPGAFGFFILTRQAKVS